MTIHSYITVLALLSSLPHLVLWRWQFPKVNIICSNCYESFRSVTLTRWRRHKPRGSIKSPVHRWTEVELALWLLGDRSSLLTENERNEAVRYRRPFSRRVRCWSITSQLPFARRWRRSKSSCLRINSILIVEITLQRSKKGIWNPSNRRRPPAIGHHPRLDSTLSGLLLDRITPSVCRITSRHRLLYRSRPPKSMRPCRTTKPSHSSRPGRTNSTPRKILPPVNFFRPALLLARKL